MLSGSIGMTTRRWMWKLEVPFRQILTLEAQVDEVRIERSKFVPAKRGSVLDSLAGTAAEEEGDGWAPAVLTKMQAVDGNLGTAQFDVVTNVPDANLGTRKVTLH